MKWHMPEINGRRRRKARRRRLMKPELPQLPDVPVWTGWGRKPIWLAAIFLLLGIVGVGVVATPGGTAALLKAQLFLNAGEDPSVSPQFLAAGHSTWDGTEARVELENLDPSRFPAGVVCQTEVRVGGISAGGVALQSGAPKGSNPPVATTVLDFRQNGTVKAGDVVEVHILCEFDGQRHETLWQGMFGSAP